MPPRSAALRLADIETAIARIESYLADIDRLQFAVDPMRSDAVVRNLEVIGEAVRHLPDELLAMQPQIPWRDIAASRNVVAHGYFAVDLDVIWTTATSDLEPLKRAVVALKKSI
jgi:uncharacterized protein with HEPN domain